MQFSRPLGDSELSYFLPSRADGVNDMYLHIGFRAPPALVNAPRLCLAWAILRGRHPLLAAHVRMKPRDYASAQFVYAAPASPQAALDDAAAALELRTSSKDALIDAYLNGPRTLAPERISYLVLATPPTAPAGALHEFDLLLCAAHFLGDGMALHTCANDLFLLLSNTDDLRAVLDAEWAARWAPGAAEATELPAALEARLPRALHAFQRAAHALEFESAQARLLGGHAFARAPHPAPRHTVVPTVAFAPAATRAALAACKARGVSIAHALFALCNVAWARRTPRAARALPTLMYSALNLRPHLAPARGSYWFLAVGYFSVVLPALLPPDARAAFWARARAAKAQSAAAARAPLLLARTRCMAAERGVRARAFALLDDGGAPPAAPPTPAPTPPAGTAPRRAPAPSTALVGLSLLGNLDGMYAHAAYGGGLALHTLTTGSRQRAGGMLLFGYTFAGRLWLSLGYDEAAFDAAEVGGWWAGVLDGVKEFLVPDEAL